MKLKLLLILCLLLSTTQVFAEEIQWVELPSMGQALAVSPNGELITVGYYDHDIQVINAFSGQVVAEGMPDAESLSTLALTFIDDSHIVVATFEKIFVGEIVDDEIIFDEEPLVAIDFVVSSMAVHADNLFAASATSQFIYVFDMGTGERLTMLDVDATVELLQEFSVLTIVEDGDRVYLRAAQYSSHQNQFYISTWQLQDDEYTVHEATVEHDGEDLFPPYPVVSVLDEQQVYVLETAINVYTSAYTTVDAGRAPDVDDIWRLLIVRYDQ